jgi:hypothetical protein
MFPTFFSQTDTLTLDEVVARLVRHEVVRGIVLVGSTGGGGVTAVSDYDLLLILSQMPVPLHVLLTTIDGRLADIIFSDEAFIEQLLARDEIVPDEVVTASKLNWLGNGRIVYDADGRLAQAQAKIAEGTWQEAVSEPAIYRVWQGIQYNYLQTKRMLLSEDTVYGTAVDLRLTYMLADVWLGYFTVRRLPWRGEKEAVRYWQVHDPHFLALFQQYQITTERREKFDLYWQMAQQALEPVGGLQDEALVLVALAGAWEMGDVETAVNFWCELLANPS